MSFTPSREQLRGLSVDWAECYGKPHVNCLYMTDGVKSHRIMRGSRCICGDPATNAHHCPPLSKGRSFLLCTPAGTHALKPSLFALCGSGTTGCHGHMHDGRYRIRWEWDDDEFARSWWDGTLLGLMPPHSPELYRLGRWVVEDRRADIWIEIRDRKPGGLLDSVERRFGHGRQG